MVDALVAACPIGWCMQASVSLRDSWVTIRKGPAEHVHLVKVQRELSRYQGSLLVVLVAIIEVPVGPQRNVKEFVEGHQLVGQSASDMGSEPAHEVSYVTRIDV